MKFADILDVASQKRELISLLYNNYEIKFYYIVQKCFKIAQKYHLSIIILTF